MGATVDVSQPCSSVPSVQSIWPSHTEPSPTHTEDKITIEATVRVFTRNSVFSKIFRVFRGTLIFSVFFFAIKICDIFTIFYAYYTLLGLYLKIHLIRFQYFLSALLAQCQF